MNRPGQTAGLSIIVIGRNEGERLRSCLKSIRSAGNMPGSLELIYVDSNSTDNSPQLAAAFGANVIVLDSGKPSAARARNAGWRAATAPFILFLDGDTILHPEFFGRAIEEFDDPRVGVVWGHRRETRTQESIFNRILDLDWIYPPGLTEFCGGDALMRRAALEEAGGFDPDLIAGEEPDLCRRMRALGKRIVHIDAPMTGHDLNVVRLNQYWMRAVRAGHAYAEVAARYRDTADPMWSKESRANLFRGSLYIALAFGICAAGVLLRSWIPLLLGALMGSALTIRTAISARWKSTSWITLFLYGLHSHAQHVAILQGQILYLWGRWKRGGRGLIEYKT